jgi:hypothetical protein
MPGALDVRHDVRPHRHVEAVLEVNLTMVLIGICCCCDDGMMTRILTESDNNGILIFRDMLLRVHDNGMMSMGTRTGKFASFLNFILYSRLNTDKSTQ